jgi:Arc-like DNA binding domain
MEQKRPPRGSDQFPLRMPQGMRDRIRIAADKAGRSMNAQILETLAAAYPDPAPVTFDLTALTAVNAILEKAGQPFRVDMVPPFPGKISFTPRPRIAAPPTGHHVILDGRTIKKD